MLRMSRALRTEIEFALGYLMGQSAYDCQHKLEKILGYKVDAEGNRTDENQLGDRDE